MTEGSSCYLACNWPSAQRIRRNHSVAILCDGWGWCHLPSFVLVPQGVATGSSCDKSVFEIKSATSAFGDVLWFHNVQQSATALTNIFFCVCVCVPVGLTVFRWFNFALLCFSPTDTFLCHCVCIKKEFTIKMSIVAVLALPWFLYVGCCRRS